MHKSEFEAKSLVFIILVGYVVNLVLGWLGALYAHGSSEQLLLFQVGNAFAISASVMAGRYAGLRGEHVAASGFILLGIAHGISLAALGREGIDPAREATMAMPMIPALLFMAWCSLFPIWLRVFAIVPSLCFAGVYASVHLGDSFATWVLYVGYGTLQTTELIWAVYFVRDWKVINQEVPDRPPVA